MKSHPLLSRFDLIGDTPGNIGQIRKLVIHLAVTGRLLGDAAKDTSPSTLLERLSQERQHLVNSGKIKETSALHPIIPSELPSGCRDVDRFERLANIAIIEKGLTGIQSAQPGAYPLVVTAEERSSCDHYDFDGRAAIIPMVSSSGHGNASLKRLHYQEGKFALGNILCAVFPISEELISARFLFEYLTAFKDELLVTKMIGTANVSLTLRKIGDVPIPIVPQVIQTRVDELMMLCDRLEAAQSDRDAHRDRLVAASFDRLSAENSDSERRESASFLLDHLPQLAARPDHIRKLRHVILKAAVGGYLCPQNGSDEPAPSFVIGNQAADSHLNMMIPVGWSWARVEHVADARLGKMLDKAKNSGTPFRYLRNTNVHWFDIRMDDLKELNIQHSEVEKYCLRVGDILICEGGHGIGRSAVWRSDEPNIIFQKALHRVRPRAVLNSDFFVYCMFVYYHAGLLQHYFTGVGIPHLTGQALAKVVFPLPPLAEQRRIVSRVQELFALCDQLECELTAVQTEGRHLLESVLYESLRAETHSESQIR